MADPIVLRAMPRSIIGKKVSRLRQEGRMPVIVYGAATEPIALDVEIKEFTQIAHSAGTTQVVSVEVDGEKAPRSVLIREVQQHVTRLTPLHADLIQVDMSRKIRAAVPVVVSVQPPMVVMGTAVLSQAINEVLVEALPADLPSSIEIDAGGMENYEDTIKVSEIELGDKTEMIEDPETVVLSLQRLRAQEVFEDEIEDEEIEDELAEGEEGEEGEEDESGADSDE